MSPTDIYPLAPIFATLSLLAVLLDIPPLIWHYKRRNWPFFTLILWLLLLNTFNFLNALLWPSAASVSPTSSHYHGAILCDIQVKLIVGSYVGLPCAFVAIMRSLAHVLDTDHINLAPTPAQQRRETTIQLTLTLLPPLLALPAHFIVQSNRYYLWSITGCNPSAAASWPSLLLLFLWPPFFALPNAYYALLLLLRIHRYRRDFSRVLAAAGCSSRSRFLRPFLLSLILLVALVPLSFWLLVVNAAYPLEPFSWRSVHAWDVGFVDGGGNVVFDRWIRLAAGYLVFVFFGLGHDARGMYLSWAKTLGWGKGFCGCGSGGRRVIGEGRTTGGSLRSRTRTRSSGSKDEESLNEVVFGSSTRTMTTERAPHVFGSRWLEDGTVSRLEEAATAAAAAEEERIEEEEETAKHVNKGDAV